LIYRRYRHAASGTGRSAIAIAGYGDGFISQTEKYADYFVSLSESEARLGFPNEFIFDDIYTNPSLLYTDDTVYNLTNVSVNKFGISRENNLTANRLDACGVCFAWNGTSTPITLSGNTYSLGFSFKRPIVVDTTSTTKGILNADMYSGCGYFMVPQSVFSTDIGVTYGSISEIVTPTTQSMYYAQDTTNLIFTF
jgi:hypothetical protein